MKLKKITLFFTRLVAVKLKINKLPAQSHMRKLCSRAESLQPTKKVKQTEWNQKAKNNIMETLSKSKSQKATINRRKRAANQPAARQRLSTRQLWQATNQPTS